MRLRLCGVGAEVGDDAEPVGGVGLADLGGEAGGAGEERRAPEVELAEVLAWGDEPHHGRPLQGVAEDDEVVVLVADGAGEVAGDDAAEHAALRAAVDVGRRHRGARFFPREPGLRWSGAVMCTAVVMRGSRSREDIASAEMAVSSFMVIMVGRRALWRWTMTW